jgi:hypothetical protein
MPLTQSYKENLYSDLRVNPEFCRALLCEAVNTMFSGDIDTGKGVLRDYINATIGFEKLAAKAKIPPKNLMRMFTPKGTLRMKGFFAVLVALQKDAGVELHVAAE